MYTQDYDETLPPASMWTVTCLPYVKNEDILHCPGTASAYSYAFNRPLGSRMVEDWEDARNTILLFEADATMRNVTGGRELLTREDRHGEKQSYGFLDGHVAFVPLGTGSLLMHWKLMRAAREKKP